MKKIKQLRSSQGKNVKMFFDQEYHNFIQKYKDINHPDTEWFLVIFI